jgi:phosphoribosylformylglycinamidine synthase
MSAKVLVIGGYGLNSEAELLHGFQYSGIDGNILHINDIIENPKVLNEVQILAVPGGFSYGDDTGSGNALAQKMKLALWEPLREFVLRDTLTIGICNGCQIITNLGLVPSFDQNYGERVIAVTHNLTARYQCRWIDLKVSSHKSPWLAGVESMHIPVAHGEGRFIMPERVLKRLEAQGQIAAQFVKPDGKSAEGEFPYNPNGSMADIAAISDETGKVLAVMPHPERGMFTWQRDDFDRLKDKAQREGRSLPEQADGMALFQNAARYFEVKSNKKFA